MRKIVFILTFISLGLTSCLMTPKSDTHYSLFILCLENQTDDSVYFASSFSSTYLIKPGDTLMTNLAISTDMDLGDSKPDSVFSNLKRSFMTRRFDSCFVSRVISVVGNVTTLDSLVIWKKPLVDLPEDSVHTIFNTNAWKMHYNLKGRTALLFTIKDSDL